MKRLFLLPFVLFPLALVGCATKEVRKSQVSCIKKVGFDTRDRFDGVKFIVSLDKSNAGKGLMENVETGAKYYVVFNDTFRNGKRNKYQQFPQSIDDVEYARFIDGRVLYLNEGCERN